MPPNVASRHRARPPFVLVALLLAVGAGAALVLPARAGTPQDAVLDPAVLVGTWTVDLRPAPDADPYDQPMEITAAGDGTLAGTFYGSDIEEARLNLDWGAVRFAFVTNDGSGPYNTTGVLREDGTLEGTTHSIGRGFLAYWTATRD